MRISWTIALVALASSQLGATDCGQAIKDPGLDLWCNGQLCAWTVERGTVTQVPTWNAGDFGAEFDGSDVAIAQLSPVASSDGGCIEVSLIADVDDAAEVDVNFDLWGDGTIDYTQRVPTSNWAPVSFVVSTAGVWSGMRFELAKHGTGHAVVAQLKASVVDAGTCSGFAPSVTATDAPLGGACVVGECGSGTCVVPPNVSAVLGEACVGCTAGSDAGCGSGEVCGLGDPASPVLDVPIECVPANARALGEPCLSNGECASNICTEGACSTCGLDNACGSGQECGRAWTEVAANGNSPYVCAPGLRAQPSGAPCASDADCQSGACSGTARMQCEDGRACASPADCPFGTGDEDALNNGPCVAVGIEGGICQ